MSLIHFFDTGNGHTVRVHQDVRYDMFLCHLMIVPKWHGVSIYNSVDSGEEALHTTLRDDVTIFINAAIEDHMLEVALDELKEEFND